MRTLLLLLLLSARCYGQFGPISPVVTSWAGEPVAAGGGGGPPGFDIAAGTNTSGSSALVNFGSSGANRLLLAGVGNFNNAAVTAITYNGSALTLVYSTNFYDSSGLCALYYLIAPASGAHDLVVTFSAPPGQAAGLCGIIVTNASQSAPLGTASAIFAGSTGYYGVTNAVACTSGDLVCDVVTIYPDLLSGNILPGGGQTQRVDSKPDESGVTGCRMSTCPASGTGTTNIFWINDTLLRNWSHIGVAVKP